MMTGARRAATPLTARGRAGGASTVKSAAGGPSGTRSSVTGEHRGGHSGDGRQAGVRPQFSCGSADTGYPAGRLASPSWNRTCAGWHFMPAIDMSTWCCRMQWPSACCCPRCATSSTRPWTPGRRSRQLCPPGRPPLDASKTLPENGITDGTPWCSPPHPRRPHAAGARHGRAACPVDRIHRPVDPGRVAGRRPDGHGRPRRDRRFPRGSRSTRRTAPAPRGQCGRRAAAIAARVTGSGRTAFAAQAFGCALIAAATLCTSVLGDTAHHTGLLLATVSTAVVVSAGRLTLLLCGLSSDANRDLDPDARDEAEPRRSPPNVLRHSSLPGPGRPRSECS